MKKTLLALAITSAGLFNAAHADDAALKATFNKIGLENPEVQDSPVKGLKAVTTPQGVIYVSEDGRFVLQGPLYDVSGERPVNLSNQALITKLDALQNEMIVYKAAHEKKVITVFTDITCGYCHKLHEQMKGYNDLGITVRYLAFPREGLGSATEKNMQSIWNTGDRKKAFDNAMRGEDISPIAKTAASKVDISKHFELGQQLGVTGTPAIVLEDGTLMPGYQPPAAMAQILGIKA
ncbi:bifunctional protein-disulfide isomerase/oxidoreductase DsbC [Rouxiella sp. T17]|uniref:bifunctional protein-disulfide isomerase/oxidoreductase DsbC n=1 Tax=Rouxiella sp. T17 TaxID=3085684 RepID=UPI002FC78FF8